VSRVQFAAGAAGRKDHMPVRLQGGYELDPFLQLVREKANGLLKDEQLTAWAVTLRPVTAADHEQAPQAEDDETEPEDRMIVFIDRGKKEMTIAGFGDGEYWKDEVDGSPDEQAQWVAEVQIIETLLEDGEEDEDGREEDEDE
jgi:hypothetical protein